MSLEDLERAGITLPRNQWGKREVRSAVNRPLFLAAAAAAIVAGILMYWGDGGGATWAGAVLFLLSFSVLIVISLHAVTAQCRPTQSADAVPDNKSGHESRSTKAL